MSGIDALREGRLDASFFSILDSRFWIPLFRPFSWQYILEEVGEEWMEEGRVVLLCKNRSTSCTA